MRLDELTPDDAKALFEWLGRASEDAKRNGRRLFVPDGARRLLSELAPLAKQMDDTPLARELARPVEQPPFDREYSCAVTATRWGISPAGVRWLLANDERLRRHARKQGLAWMLDADFVDAEAARRAD